MLINAHIIKKYTFSKTLPRFEKPMFRTGTVFPNHRRTAKAKQNLELYLNEILQIKDEMLFSLKLKAEPGKYRSLPAFQKYQHQLDINY